MPCSARGPCTRRAPGAAAELAPSSCVRVRAGVQCGRWCACVCECALVCVPACARARVPCVCASLALRVRVRVCVTGRGARVRCVGMGWVGRKKSHTKRSHPPNTGGGGRSSTAHAFRKSDAARDRVPMTRATLASCAYGAPRMHRACTWLAQCVPLVCSSRALCVHMACIMACTVRALRVHLACTWYAPRVHHVCTWCVPVRLACTVRAPGVHRAFTWQARVVTAARRLHFCHRALLPPGSVSHATAR